MKHLFTRRTRVALIAMATIAIVGPSVYAGKVINYVDPLFPGMTAQAEFTLTTPTTLEIRLANTSTGLITGADNSDQILTGLSWDLGEVGFNGDIMITGGSVITASTASPWTSTSPMSSAMRTSAANTATATWTAPGP